MEHWLRELGEARRQGLLERTAADAGFPWKAAERVAGPASSQIGFWVRHRRLRWGLTAAAVVGIAVVGLWQLDGLSGKAPIPEGQPALQFAEIDTAPKASVPVAQLAQASQSTELYDANGDGRIDGDDIQGLVNRMHDAQEGQGITGSKKDASELVNRLLGI